MLQVLCQILRLDYCRLLYFVLRINLFRQFVYPHLLDKETKSGPGGKATCPQSPSWSVGTAGVQPQRCLSYSPCAASGVSLPTEQGPARPRKLHEVLSRTMTAWSQEQNKV